MDIFLNKKQWNQFSEKELYQYIDEVFNYYRKKGFPYFPTDEVFRKKEFEKFLKVDYISLYKDDIIGQHMAGLAYCWSFMPHAFNVQCNNLKTPLEVFNNDELLKKVIYKRIKMGDNMSDNGLRKMLKIFSGTQAVSNFRPTAAAVIYDLYGKNKNVWDMSAGYGGRLLGAIKAGVKSYIGTEPCTETYNGLLSILQNVQYWVKSKIEIYKCGSEDFIPENNSIDLCFTSPPYFDTEKYSNEITQSYKKYPTKSEWLNGYLKQTFINCYNGLKLNGVMAINIANVKSYNTLENDCVKLAEEIGFKLEKIIKYSLSSLNKNNKYKYEPIFIFRKYYE